MSKMVFTNEFVPNEQDAIKSILDYEIKIKDLRPDQTHYVALGKLMEESMTVLGDFKQKAGASFSF